MRATLHAAAYLPSIVRPMSWLRDLKLGDLPAEEALEIVCPLCPIRDSGRTINTHPARSF